MKRIPVIFALIGLCAILLTTGGCAVNGVDINTVTMRFSVPADSELIGKQLYIFSSYDSGSISGNYGEYTIQEDNILVWAPNQGFYAPYNEADNYGELRFYVRIGEKYKLAADSQQSITVELSKTGSQIHELTTTDNYAIASHYNPFLANFEIRYSYGAWH